MTVPEPQIDRSHPSPNRGYSNGFSHRPEAIVDHITDGTDSLGWLTSPLSGASSNYLIRRDGYIYELVPPDQSAWANGAVNDPDLNNPVIASWEAEGCNYNQRTISIEHEQTGVQDTTEAQWLATAQLQAWLCERFDIEQDELHIIPHSSIDSVDRPHCSGWTTAEWDRLFELIDSWWYTDSEVGGATLDDFAADSISLVFNSRAEACLVVNFGGTASYVAGINVVDAGVSVVNDAGETFDRSVLLNTFQPWSTRPAGDADADN
jgi:N-acetyl-anhydromuramyl-L-alanine amidase AmpD